MELRPGKSSLANAYPAMGAVMIMPILTAMAMTALLNMFFRMGTGPLTASA